LAPKITFYWVRGRLGVQGMLTPEDKKRILRALMEDEEFRLAIAGAVGLGSILGELKKLREEHDKRFEAIERKLLEHDKRFEAIEKKLLEHDKRFEAIERKLLEHDKRFEVVFEELKKIWKTLERHQKILENLLKRVSRLELYVGALSESFYSKALWDDLKEEIQATGEKIESRKRNARLGDVEIDMLVVTNKRIIIVEVKVKPKIEDVGVLIAKADIARKAYPGRTVTPIIAGSMIGREVEEYAEAKNVKVYTY